VTFNTVKWPKIVESTAEGTWTAQDSEKRVECTISIRRDADDRTLVSYESRENGSYLSSLAVMATTETTPAAMDEVCTHMLLNTPGLWNPLVASFREKYAASPKMKVTTNYVRDQSVTINPDEWAVIAEASQEVDPECDAWRDYNTATLRLHRHPDGRVLLRATTTWRKYDGETDYGLFLPADTNMCSQVAPQAYSYSLEKFLEFCEQHENWKYLLQEFQSKIDVAFPPTPVKKAKKAKNVSPYQPRALAFASEGGNKMPNPIQ
jgi:hypothetical protein